MEPHVLIPLSGTAAGFIIIGATDSLMGNFLQKDAKDKR